MRDDVEQRGCLCLNHPSYSHLGKHEMFFKKNPPTLLKHPEGRL
jgi:hypothetical protein